MRVKSAYGTFTFYQGGVAMSDGEIAVSQPRSFGLSKEDAEKVRGIEGRKYTWCDIEGEGREPLYEYTLPDGTVLQECFDHGYHLALRCKP